LSCFFSSLAIAGDRNRLIADMSATSDAAPTAVADRKPRREKGDAGKARPLVWARDGRFESLSSGPPA
jgi:hypothetical protein